MASNNYDKLDYYKILQVTQDASDEVIRQKYRDLAKFWHPDHNNDPNALDNFQKISIAYDVLKNKETRLKYDLLSIIYEKHNFPNMDALALIRNVHGEEDLSLRAFRLIEITGKGFLHKTIDKNYYCNPSEAMAIIKKITKHNWLNGFWGITAFFANIKAIVCNILNINDKKANLQLLLHNSLVYFDEKKSPEAATMAIQATAYASKKELAYINSYISVINATSTLPVRKWNFCKLVQIQLVYPLILIFLLLLIIGLVLFSHRKNNSYIENDIKQVITFADGYKTFSDVSVAKFFDVPVDINDTKMLYHTTTKVRAMHGADKSFDVYKIVDENVTVRVTGYTLDKKWFRVMFDNGEMAFIEATKLQQGVGKEIPLWSKIYKEN